MILIPVPVCLGNPSLVVCLCPLVGRRTGAEWMDWGATAPNPSPAPAIYGSYVFTISVFFFINL